MSSEGLTYLITGANRGIGLGLVEALVARPRTTVIAAVRDPAASSSAFAKVSPGTSSKLVIVKLDMSSETDALDAAKRLEACHRISHIDVLVSNAGIMEPSAISSVLSTPIEKVRKHVEVNAFGPLLLIQAFYPLLEKSAAPQFLSITSGIGSLGSIGKYSVPFYAYGTSKAAQNYLVAKLAQEIPTLVSIAYSPGWVQTDMGNGAAKGVGMESAPLTLEATIPKLLKLFDEASLENTGKFFNQDGEIIPW